VSHTLHPSVQETGLADGCPRCAELAANPLADLDDGILLELVRRTVDDRFGYYGDASARARSEAEAVAMANVMTQLERTGRLFQAAPGPVCRYLDGRWDVRVTAARTT
jgi:hypothetical protein